MAITRLTHACATAALVCSLATTGNAQTEDRVVLQTDDFTVTEQDFLYYLIERDVKPEDEARLLGKEGAVRNLFENLYVTRAYAAKALNNPEIDAADREEIEWAVSIQRDRLLMNRQLDLEIAAEMAKVNWEQAAREEYLGNPDQFRIPEQIDAEHILLRSDERGEEAALQRAEEVLAKLQDGADFAAMVQEYSEDDASKSRAGRLGFFARGQMVAPFEVAAFELEQPGELSEPVQTEFGYHIIRLVERRAASQQAFDTVKDRLIPQVQQRREAMIRANLINAVKSGQVDLGLEVDSEALAEIEARYAAEAEE